LLVTSYKKIVQLTASKRVSVHLNMTYSFRHGRLAWHHLCK